MSEPSREMAPGCYGSPSCHGNAKLVCSRCPWERSCGVRAEERAAVLRDRFNIAGVIGSNRPKKAAGVRRNDAGLATIHRPATNTAILAAGIPVKAKELLDNLARRGIDPARALSVRLNPFQSGTPAYMRTVFDLLLAGGYSRHELSDALIENHGWARSSADSHAGFATAAMLACGAVRERDGRIVPADRETTV